MRAWRVSLADDLGKLVAEINAASWEESNEISPYDADSLSAYLERQDTVFVACHSNQEGTGCLLGIASARFELKPYAGERWLYVDEVDVCADQRRNGAGAALMRKLIELAQIEGCEEVWLGTEVDNKPANALYRSLAPDDVSAVIGYTYETDE